MSLMAKAKFESFRETKLQVFYNVQRTWNELQKVQQSIVINEKNLEILHSLERLSLVKFKAGSSGGGSPSGSSGSSGNSASAQSSSGMNTMGGNSGNSAPTTSAAMQTSPHDGFRRFRIGRYLPHTNGNGRTGKQYRLAEKSGTNHCCPIQQLSESSIANVGYTSGDT